MSGVTSSSYHQPLLQKFVRNKLPKSKDSLMEYTRNQIFRDEVEDAEAVFTQQKRLLFGRAHGVIYFSLISDSGLCIIIA